MITLYVIDKDTGFLLRSDTGDPASLMLDISDNEMFVSIAPPENYGTWRWMNDKWVELPSINNPATPYGDEYVWNVEQGQWVLSPELAAYKHVENQAVMWERIKQKRRQATASGVYIPSIDKRLHTDEMSAMLYANIGNAISLGAFSPLNWKTMEGDFVEMNESLYREMQSCMMQKTEANYAKAEWHKYMMLQSDDPLNYDYSQGWTEDTDN